MQRSIRAGSAHLAGASALVLAMALATSALAQSRPSPTDAERAQERLEAQAEPTASEANDKDSTNIGEVVITARKRAERLRDVPIAATVINADVLGNRGGVADVQTALSTVPGLRYFDTSTPTNSEIALRSSGTSRGNNSEAGVGLYRNGAYIAGGGNLGGRNYATIDLLDVSRIEVLRGTQAALYGRNSVGGAINVISAEPTHRFEGYASVKYAFENERAEVEGAVNVPINDQWSTRFSARYIDQESGFFLNTFNNVYHDQENGYAARAQLRYDGGALKINWLAEQQIETVPALFYENYILPGAATGYPLGYFDPKYQTIWNRAPLAKQNVQTLNMSINWDMGWGTLTSTSDFRRRKSLQVYDGDATNPAALALQQAMGNATTITDANASNENNNTAHIYYEDIHLAKTKVDRISALLGAEYLQISSDQRNLTGRTPTRANTSIGNVTTTYTDIKSWSVYGSGGYDLTSRLNLSFEARYTKDDRYLSANRVDRVTGLQNGAVLINNVTYEPDNFSYNAIASFHPDSNWLIYAKYGTGFRAGGFNTGVGDIRQPVQIPAAFGDETSGTGEIGAKGNLLKNVYATVAAYRSEIDGFIVQLTNGCATTNPVCPVAPTTFLVNAGTAHTWGVEFEATARFTLFGSPLRFDGSLSRTGGKVVEGTYAGAHIPQSPDWLGSLAMNYTHPLGYGLTAFGNFNYNFSVGGVQEIEQIPPLYDFDRADARAGLQYRTWEAAVYATNIFDESHVIYSTSTVRRYNQPRVVGLQLRYRW